MKPFSWSYTALTGFETCPHRHYRTKVIKDIPDPIGKEGLWGREVHTALEHRIKDKKPLPEGMEQWESIAAAIERSNGRVFAEQQLAITKDFKPTTWFAGDVWCRGIIDVGSINDTKMVALDYKTGKRQIDNDQLELFAGLIFAHYPRVEVVHTGFIWLKEKPEKQIDRNKYTREEIPIIWQNFLPRVNRMEAARETNAYPKRPSGLCKSWCPVKDCEFCGK
jgi:hypothetical protein